MVKKHCKSIEITGNTGSIYDIVYTLNDNIKRGIQIKSLSKNKYKDNVFCTHINRSKRSI